MIALLTLLSLAWAQDDEGLEIEGELRVIGSTLSDFPVDAEGTVTGGRFLDHRLRTGTRGRIHPLVEAGLQLDLATGTLVADEWAFRYTPDERERETAAALSGPQAIKVRELSATTMSGNTQLELGAVTSQWGLGMVANDGNTEPLFGRADYGDRVLRFRATQLPGGDGPPPKTSILITGAFDLVIADEISTLRTGERAVQGIASILALGRRGSEVGAYFVVRNQWEDEQGRSTQAWVLDSYADAWHDLGGGVKLRTAGEVAGIVGRTSRATTYNSRNHVGLASLGAVGQLTLSGEEDRLQLHLHTGYASGDGDPDDGVSHDFSFDRDYGVGMVLFDEVMSGIEAATWLRVTDPVLSGQAPDGAELLTTEGSVRRASYLQPVFEFEPHPWVNVRLGAAWSFGTAYFAQPFYSVRGGGTPHNHLNQPVTSRYLGGEADWSLIFGPPERDDEGVGYAFQLQGGHFGPGPALAGPGMPSTVHLVTGTARLLW